MDHRDLSKPKEFSKNHDISKSAFKLETKMHACKVCLFIQSN